MIVLQIGGIIAIEIRLSRDSNHPIVDGARFSGGSPIVGVEGCEFVLFIGQAMRRF
jgi:hypothetical protein